MMDPDWSESFDRTVCRATGASSFSVREMIQELWSGYGKILRLDLEGAEPGSVIAKHVRVPGGGLHPRGWNSDISHQRKLRSYQVETYWYQHWSDRCDSSCRIPQFLAADGEGDEVLLLLEDLDAAGFPRRIASVDEKQVEACLSWLGNFHATFLTEEPEGLWPVGTYWHLDTRPDELVVLDDVELRNAATQIDEILNQAQFQTLVHGDAKLANFCFPEVGGDVAAVDFQYVGGGCGMKDVAYFLGSCLDESSCEENEVDLLDAYFSFLRKSIREKKPELDPNAVEREWRELYPVAWTDFHRFLKGWCPGHWKLNSYSERLAREVIASLNDLDQFSG